MKALKNLSILLFLVVSILVSSNVYGLNSSDINIVSIEANDVVLSQTAPKSVKVTDEIELLIVFDSDINASDLHVEAVLRGNELDLVEDITEVFEVVEGNRYDVRLTLELPQRLDQRRYDIKIRFDQNVGETYTVLYPLDIGAARHALEIKDVVFDPENKQEANRAVLTKVRIKNYGEKDEESVKVKVSIPELGLSASDYIDELKAGDSVTSSELYMRIPAGTETGQYVVKVTLEYNDGDKVEEEEFTYRIVGADEEEDEEDDEEETSTQKTVITVSQETQTATAGVGGVVYPITITNKGTEARTYTVEVDGTSDWASTKVTPSNVMIIEGGETKSLYVYVSARESANAGEYMFSVVVKSGETALKQVPLKTLVAASEAKTSLVSRSTLVKVLQVGLVTFVVLLVILGLIVGFSKLRGEEVEEPEEGSEKFY